MLQQEFQERVGFVVGSLEWEAIHTVYLHADVDKDEFCKIWKHMNRQRIREGKAIQKRRYEDEKKMARKRIYAYLSVCENNRNVYHEEQLLRHFGAVTYREIMKHARETDIDEEWKGEFPLFGTVRIKWIRYADKAHIAARRKAFKAMYA